LLGIYGCGSSSTGFFLVAAPLCTENFIRLMRRGKLSPFQSWPDCINIINTSGYDFRKGQVWINVTQNPTAEWIARQLTEAFPWNEAPPYLIRDRDRIYGDVAIRRIRAMGIRDKPIAPATGEWHAIKAVVPSNQSSGISHTSSK
jgi:hypothetical protein